LGSIGPTSIKGVGFDKFEYDMPFEEGEEKVISSALILEV